ncbi:MAG: sigma-70 family RNA polymerase sigma factor [Thermomicrobiales bacterium]|nr:sigma-70 family RNA polymerase sigma factor [Thermomicrobiales bacterium]
MSESDPQTDEALIAALGQGDAEALGVLYDRYQRLAMAVAYRILNDTTATEDTLQDAFLQVWRNHQSFDPRRGNVRSWLMTIVRNAAIDRLRGRAGRARQDRSLDEIDYLLGEHDDPFQQAVESIQADQIRAAIEQLPSEQRDAIALAYFNGLTQQEIADRTGAPLGTVKGRMRLGLRKLREHLMETGWDGAP